MITIFEGILSLSTRTVFCKGTLILFCSVLQTGKIDNENRISPIFFKHRDVVPRYVRVELILTTFEVCTAACNVIDEEMIDGAQCINGIWRIYTKSKNARAELLTHGINLRGKSISLLDENPLGNRNRQGEQLTEKITTGKLPLDVDNDKILNLIK